jgi:hypothetical protein
VAKKHSSNARYGNTNSRGKVEYFYAPTGKSVTTNLEWGKVHAFATRYVANDASPKEICADIGISYALGRKWATKLGILRTNKESKICLVEARRGQDWINKKAEVFRLRREQDLRSVEISDLTGVPTATVQRLLSQAGLGWTRSKAARIQNLARKTVAH